MCEECYRIEEIAGREQDRLIEQINSHICDGGDPLTDPRVIELVEAAKPAQRILDVLNQNGLLPSGGQGVLARLLLALAAVEEK